MRRALWILLAILALAAVGFWWWPQPQQQDDGFSLQGLLGGESEGYARADSGREFRFPADHGPHPDYRSEWWYITGNLTSAEGRPYGFHFTIFRFALAPEERPGTSEWSTRQAYMAHFAVVDVDAGRVYDYERFSRGAAGLAGASADPLRVWLEDWELSGENQDAWTLAAAADEVGLRLQLDPRKDPVLQGEAGLSLKGPEPGNASYYYSLPRIAASGELRLGEQRLEISGSAWMDREWGSSALGPDLEGWDWFALQLDDGSELMLYQLRRADGSRSTFSAATYIPAQGEPRHLQSQDFELEPVERWRSANTEVSYPIAWDLRIPELDLELSVAARTPNQELDLSVRYWEGAVSVAGQQAERPVQGVGYMELTGYGETGGVRGGR